MSAAVLESLRRYTNGTVTRVAGADRIATAVALSAATFTPGVTHAFLATASTFPDALAAGAVGAALHAPVLLTARDSLSPATAGELDRLNPGRIVVLGGSDAVSPGVEQAARVYSANVERRAGSDRFSTAVAVGDLLNPSGGSVYLASGRGFADALSAAPAAGRTRAPLLLVEPSCVPDATRAAITRYAPERHVVLGGPQAVSPAVETLTPCADLSQVRIVRTQIAVLDEPLALTVRSGDTALYIAEKGGRVQRIADGGAATTVLDIRSQVSTGSEQGLLGLAFSPDGGRLYVDYTDAGGDTHVVSYAMTGNVATPGSARPILTVEQPFSNHNGGEVVFGPDGMLYVGLGDGGSAHDPQNNAQRLGTLLGKLLRIDADGVWITGVHDPGRQSVHEPERRATGDLDVGLAQPVAVLVRPRDGRPVDRRRRPERSARRSTSAPAGTAAGANFGWARLEGTHATASGCAAARSRTADHRVHDGLGRHLRNHRRLRLPRHARAAPARAVPVRRLLRRPRTRARAVRRRSDRLGVDLGVTVPSLSSFGEDAAGELYALSLEGPVYRLDPAP